ncbi:hypothetical protein ACVIWV_006125 [Bradyrhizobium diazoefficiens]|uniref:hypothetical protein n=1 Tax=Bradyrhizobium TaxID=374 RepID=UPI000AB1736B|nr:hypothetical protein [Bradyrhizobium diazoefficiens]MBR0867194.1 hypothetical protein [Bradyrhizobium diazoefficiens]MBR0891766.1 hypothetical protein [Bradyrhizobium diazoefficiens]MBR0923458.1 hypothetical protein [Bradyrhizobium diazoefficiens]
MTKKDSKIPMDRWKPSELAASAESWMRADRTVIGKLHRRTRDGWQVKRVKELLPKAFPPDGHPPDNMTLQAIQTRLRSLLEKGAKLPSTDSIARALGRRGSRA